MNKRHAPSWMFDALEPRRRLNAAFDYIGLAQLRDDQCRRRAQVGVGVAVLDTGLDRTHPLLSVGYLGGTNIADGGSDPVDREDHGTHVAGIIGARDPEIGAAPDAGLVGVKVLGDNGSGTFTDIRDGLRWVYDNRQRYNIQVVNMSLGGGFYTSAGQLNGDILQPEIRRLEGAGITVVSAGGNSYKGHEYQNFAAPGIYSTLVVGATWKDGTSRNVQWGDGAIDYTTGAGRITSFSQRLVAPNTIFAPGAFIRSTVPGGRFDNMAGTSQASPLVAGCVALLQEAAKQFGGRSLSPSEVRDVIESTAGSIFDGDDEDDNVQNTQVNYKRLDIYAAVQEVRRRLGGGGNNGGGGGGTPVEDPNGLISGAILVNPSLDGSATLEASGRIGSDGAVDIGADDVDIYRIELASAGRLIISTSTNTGDPQDFDTYVRLFADNGSLIASDDDGAGNGGFAHLEVADLSPGVYYLGVSGAGNSNYDPAGGGRTDGATGSYTVSFALSNIDPNGLLSGAVSVVFGSDLQPATFAGLIGADYGNPVGSLDVDLFKVVIPDNGTLLIDVDTLDASGYVDSFLRVLSENGMQLASSDDDLARDLAGNFVEREAAPGDSQVIDSTTGQFAGHVTDSFIKLTVTRGGVYYFGVSDYLNQAYDPTNLNNRSSAGPGGTYSLTFRFISTDVNGSIAQAVIGRAIPFEAANGAIGTDSDPISGASQDVGDKDVDFVRIVVTSQSLLEIDVDSTINYTGNTAPFDSTLTLFNANGDRIAFNDDFEGTDPLIQYLAQPGTYYFAIAGFGNDSFDPFSLGSGSPGATGNYRVSVRLFSKSSVKFVADDTIGFTDIQNLPVGSTVRGVLGTDTGYASGSADVDLYKYVAPSNGFVTAAADGQESFSADTFLRVFDSSGKELAYNDNRAADERGSLVTAAVKKGKTYYIGVSGAGTNPRAYNPKSYGRAVDGSTGSYVLSASFNGPPTLTTVGNLTGADAGVPLTITYDMLAAAANESDPENQAVSFIVAKVSSGTLTKNNAAVVAGQTRLSAGESLVWTPTARSSGVTKAFTIQASDGVQQNPKAVQVSVVVNAAPTLTSVKEIKFAAPAPGTNPPVQISFATLLASANESDKNKDPISFRIESVLTGGLSIGDTAVTPGTTLFSAGQTLTYQPTAEAVGSVLAFTIRAYDGRLYSSTSVVVKLRINR